MDKEGSPCHCVGQRFPPHCTELGQPLPMEAGAQHTQLPPLSASSCPWSEDRDKRALPELPAASPFAPLQLSLLCMNSSPGCSEQEQPARGLQCCKAARHPSVPPQCCSVGSGAGAARASEQPLPSSPHPREVLWGYSWANNLKRKGRQKARTTI